MARDEEYYEWGGVGGRKVGKSGHRAMSVTTGLSHHIFEQQMQYLAGSKP